MAIDETLFDAEKVLQEAPNSKRAWGCNSKAKFKLWAHAQKAIDRQTRANKGERLGLHIYPCPYGPHFHITHKDD